MFFRRFSLSVCTRWLLSGVIGLALAACAQQPSKPLAPGAVRPAKPSQAARPAPKAAASAGAAAAAADADEQGLPKQELTEEVLYEYLLAEIAGQRGALGLSAQAYLDLAKRTRDPRIARRAAEIAVYARMPAAAIEAARIWYETDPSSMQALQTLARLLIGAKREDEALPYLKKLVAGERGADGFLRLWHLLANNQDKARSLRLVQQLAQPYPDLAQAHFAISQAAAAAGENELALGEVRKAATLKPDWELPVLLEAQLLQRQSSAQALQHLAAYLERYPKAREVRLSYARLLVSERKYREARAEFEILSKDHPDNADVAFAVGVLSLQLKDNALATAQFKRVLELPYRDKDTVRLYLGQIAEENKDYPGALRWYGEIEDGEQYLQAQLRYALVLDKQGKLDAARAYLRQIRVSSDQERVRVVQTEAQMLREANRLNEAYAVIGNALKDMPNQPELLYDHAMLAEKLDHLDTVESNLKKLIRLQPDHAHAYNALGYSLADRNVRLPEAEQLIQKALQLSPDDPFIIDSMGWVLYRMGKSKLALEYLRKAYTARPDPEIAAHLGEVLWVGGERSEAEKIWREASQRTPDNEALNSTIKRFEH